MLLFWIILATIYATGVVLLPVVLWLWAEDCPFDCFDMLGIMLLWPPILVGCIFSKLWGEF